MFILLLIALTTSILTVLVVMPIIINNTENAGLLDIPNERKIHTSPVSRFGGVCFVPAIFLSLSIALMLATPLEAPIGEALEGINNSWRFIVLLLSSFVLFVTGIYDDLYGLGYKSKFVSQFVASMFVCFGLVYPQYGFNVQMVIEIVFVVYVINSINLIDGIDGLAAGIGMVALFALIACHIELNDWFGAIVGCAALGTLSTFFYFNVVSINYKVFMGDTGSMTLGLVIGYLIVSLSALEDQQSSQSIYSITHTLSFACISTIAIPLLDVIRVMVVRIVDGVNPFLPDKRHIHHLLLNAGLSPIRVMSVLVAASFLISVLTWGILTYINSL